MRSSLIAVAHGRAMINDCDPTCAAGSMTDQGVFRVTLYRLRPGTCNGEQVHMYTRARVVWPVAAKLDPETARLRKRCGW